MPARGDGAVACARRLARCLDAPSETLYTIKRHGRLQPRRRVSESCQPVRRRCPSDDRRLDLMRGQVHEPAQQLQSMRARSVDATHMTCSAEARANGHPYTRKQAEQGYRLDRQEARKRRQAVVKMNDPRGERRRSVRLSRPSLGDELDALDERAVERVGQQLAVREAGDCTGTCESDVALADAGTERKSRTSDRRSTWMGVRRHGRGVGCEPKEVRDGRQMEPFVCRAPAVSPATTAAAAAATGPAAAVTAPAR